MCGIALVTEMCRVNPETLSHFRRVSLCSSSMQAKATMQSYCHTQKMNVFGMLIVLWSTALQVNTCRQTMKPQINQPTVFL